MQLPNALNRKFLEGEGSAKTQDEYGIIRRRRQISEMTFIAASFSFVFEMGLNTPLYNNSPEGLPKLSANQAIGNVDVAK